MSLESFEYPLFLAGVLLVWYFVRPARGWFVLLAASVAFYAARELPSLLAVLAFVTLVSYLCGREIARRRSDTARAVLFWLGIGTNALVLLVVRTLVFFRSAGTDDSRLAPDDPIQGPLVTVGVSYYVLQAISYLVDVYAGVQQPEEHLGYFALYLWFFPKLLQGPIERAQDLIPQLRSHREFRYEDARDGLILFAWGLFKKRVIADRLGLYVDPVFDDVHAWGGAPLLVATYLYALQIFCDFSGYTDMALGSARLFGIQLTQNFRSPYLATSILDFWRRWHISFSRWLLDYIFQPLQMTFRRSEKLGTAAALLLTFLVSGLWHGFRPTFVAWGLLHGFYAAVSVAGRPVRAALSGAFSPGSEWLLILLQRTVTFHLVCLAWIFFRARSLDDAWYIVNNLSAGFVGTRSHLLQHGRFDFVLLLVLVCLVALVHAADSDQKVDRLFRQHRAWLRWTLYAGLIVSTLLLELERKSPFIYLQF